MTKAELYPTAKHLLEAIIYFMKETDRLNEVRTANATPIPHVGNAVEVNMSRVLCEALSERLSSVA